MAINFPTSPNTNDIHTESDLSWKFNGTAWVLRPAGTPSSESSKVSYTPEGTGAVDTTVEAKLRESVSVKDFGAVGDGVTDDTAKIQAAVDAVSAAGGGTLLILAGTYLVSSSINVGSNIHIRGRGQIILDDNADCSVISINANSSNVSIKDISIDGNRLNQTLETVGEESEYGGIEIGNFCDQVLIDGCTITECYGYGIENNNSPSNITITNNTIDGVDFYSGIRMSQAGTGTNIKVANNTVLNYRKGGIVGNDMNHAIITGNYIDAGTIGRGTQNADNITAYNATNIDILVADNICKNSVNNGIHVAGTGVVISGNTVTNPTNRGIYVGATTDVLNTGQSDEVVVSSNTVRDTANTYEGIALVATSQGVVKNNTVSGHNYGVLLSSGAGASVSELIVVAGNILDTIGNSGVIITDTSDTTIKNNIISNAVHGVRAFSEASNNIAIRGNTFTNLSAAYINMENNMAERFVISDNVRDGQNINFGTNTENSWADRELNNNVTTAPTQNKLTLASNTYANIDYIRIENTSPVTVDTITPNNCYGRIVTFYQPNNSADVTFVNASGKIHNRSNSNVVLGYRQSISYICEGGLWVEL